MPDRNGKIENVTLSLDSLADYLTGHPCFGSTIGRYANRIAKGKFTHRRHGVHAGHQQRPQPPARRHRASTSACGRPSRSKTADSVGVAFSYESPDGEEGYPGNLTAKVTYRLTDGNELKMDYAATTDKPTVVNLTNHAYWNLAGAGCGRRAGTPIDDQRRPLSAGRRRPDPLGELKPSGTPMDFTQPMTIGSRIGQVEGGYDHCYVLDKKEGEKGPTCRCGAVEPEERPRHGGLHHPAGRATLHGQRTRWHASRRRAAYSETRRALPGGPALSRLAQPPAYPSTLLKPGETYKQVTVHKFSTD